MDQDQDKKKKLNWNKDSFSKLQQGFNRKPAIVEDEKEEDEEDKKPGFTDRMKKWIGN